MLFPFLSRAREVTLRHVNGWVNTYQLSLIRILLQFIWLTQGCNFLGQGMYEIRVRHCREQAATFRQDASTHRREHTGGAPPVCSLRCVLTHPRGSTGGELAFTA